MNLLGSKTLETKHLLLREHKVEDYKQVYNNYANSEIVTKYLTWKAHENEEVTKDYLKSVKDRKTCVFRSFQSVKKL